MVLLTLVKVLLALVPRAVMATMHTAIISASITAYSTAVGPSSRFGKFTTLWVSLRASTIPLGDLVLDAPDAGRVPCSLAGVTATQFFPETAPEPQSWG